MSMLDMSLDDLVDSKTLRGRKGGGGGGGPRKGKGARRPGGKGKGWGGGGGWGGGFFYSPPPEFFDSYDFAPEPAPYFGREAGGGGYASSRFEPAPRSRPYFEQGGGGKVVRAPAPAPEPKQPQGNKCQVSGIPTDWEEEDILSVLQTAGDVGKLTIYSDSKDRPTGVVQVEYTRPEDARAAVRDLDGARLGDNDISVGFVKAEKAPQRDSRVSWAQQPSAAPEPEPEIRRELEPRAYRGDYDDEEPWGGRGGGKGRSFGGGKGKGRREGKGRGDTRVVKDYSKDDLDRELDSFLKRGAE